MASERSTPLSLKSRRSPRRALRDEEKDDLRGELEEGRRETRQLLTEVLSRLNELESTSASQIVVAEINPGFQNL